MGPQQQELRRQLDWLMTFRVVIITTLMICTFVIELMYRPLLSLQPFYLLGVVTYAMTIAYAVLSRTVQAVRPRMYASMGFLIQHRVLTPYAVWVEENEVATVRILYSLVAHLVSFFAVAYLASYLTENLRRAGRELEMRRDDLAQLRDYNDHIIE